MKKIESLLKILKMEYMFMWLLIVIAVVLYETDFIPQGTMVGNAKAEYLSQLTGVLLCVCLIPMSLRMFGLFISKNIKTMNMENALRSYRRWSEVRIIMLFVVALFNISMYYWTMDITGLLCGCMALLASLFCVPGRKRLLSELDMEYENIAED